LFSGTVTPGGGNTGEIGNVKVVNVDDTIEIGETTTFIQKGKQ
jgi:hypothetical protein